MAKEDLLEYAKSDVDFYALLGVAFETSESDIRRAYRKTALKYHPDKLGKDFDPEKFHLLQVANDVLSDPTAKAVYDSARNAKLQKQRQNELFEGKRRQMKEELEAREKGGVANSQVGVKRGREDDEVASEIKRLAEEGKRRRREMEEKLRASGGSIPTTPKPAASAAKLTVESKAQTHPAPQAPPQTTAEEAEEEDEIARLERRIREAEEAKARRKAEKKARKSGVFQAAESPAVGAGKEEKPKDGATPVQRSDIFKGLKADEKPSASPKFSFSPSTPASKTGFAQTMERLKAAERARLENEIRRKESAQ